MLTKPEKPVTFADEDMVIEENPEVCFSAVKAERESKEILSMIPKTHFEALKYPESMAGHFVVVARKSDAVGRGNG